MTIAFERPVGAPADVKELEYVSALTQTSMPELRTNGSLFGTFIIRVLFTLFLCGVLELDLTFIFTQHCFARS
jgi:hypothetical protein